MPPSTVTFVTTNRGKFLSAKRNLAPWGIRIVQKALDIPEPRGTIEEIARAKARYAFRALRKPLMVMDAGFFIPALNGFPGMFVNFTLQTIGLEGLLALVKGKNRRCEFHEVLCYHGGSRSGLRIFERVVRGRLSRTPQGKMQPHHWSALALVFVPEGFRRTMAAMTEGEYERFRVKVDRDSHWVRFGRYFTHRNRRR